MYSEEIYKNKILVLKVVFTQDLEAKYKDTDKVKDLISRKTTANQYEENPDFPGDEEYKIMIYVINMVSTVYLSNIYSLCLPAFRSNGCIGAGRQPLRLTRMPELMRLVLPLLAEFRLRMLKD